MQGNLAISDESIKAGVSEHWGYTGDIAKYIAAYCHYNYNHIHDYDYDYNCDYDFIEL